MLVLGCSQEPRPPEPIPVGDYTYASEWLDWRIETVAQQEDVPAIAVALVDGQQVVYQRVLGLADRENEVPADLQTFWRVGSVTKLFTAFAILREVDKGVLDLDAPITDWIPEATFPSRFEATEPITARHLLAHRSGLPRNSGLPEWYWEAGEDPTQLFPLQTEALTTQQLPHPPGERYHYSNAGYGVLAHLLDTTGDLWGELLYDEILDPIGMQGSAIALGHLPADAIVAMGHADIDGESVPTVQYDVIALASSSLIVQVDHLTAFARWVFRDGDGVLEPDTMWASFEPQYARLRDPEEHGLGWSTTSRRFDEQLVYHTGTMHGTSTIVALLPESQLAVVVIGNSDRFAQPANQIAVEALDLMLETRGTPTQTREPPEAVDVSSDELDSFVGTWIVGGEPAQVERSGERLYVHYQGVRLRMLPIGDDTFTLDHWLGDPGDIRLTFRLGEPDLLIVDLESMDYQIGLRYDGDGLPAQWLDLVGQYERRPRIPSIGWDADASWASEVTLGDGGVLMLPGKPLWPISDTELLVVGGQWDGETVIWDPELRQLTHGAYTWTWQSLPAESCGCQTNPSGPTLLGLLVGLWGWRQRRRRSTQYRSDGLNL
jgi:MYXO-CTERM domain-containing protein